MWLSLLATLGSSSCEFPPSSACAGKSLSGNTYDLLRGAHLKVLEMEWPPYATKDPTASHGWTGYDIDLFDEGDFVNKVQ